MDPVFSYRDPGTERPKEGPLHGLRIAAQSSISSAGWPADAGSNALANYVALEDATVVRRLRDAGAALCGSTRMSEFGFGLEGSAAGRALQSRAVDAELVMDLMGESRLAGAAAGVCALKPSYGLISRYGLIGLIPSMECCGLLSAGLETIRQMLKSMAGQDGRDFSLPDEEPPDLSLRALGPAEMTVGVIAEARAALPAAQQAAFGASLDALEEAGLTLREVSFPEWDQFLLVHEIVGSVEASSCAGRYDSVRYGPRAPGARNWNEMYLLSRGAAFGPLLKSYLFQGAFFQFERYAAFEDACRIRGRLVKGMQRLAAEEEFLALPAGGCASGGAPTSLADLYAPFAWTAFANVTGQPALYLPGPAAAAGAGIQIAGPRLSDARLLALGELLLNARKGGN